MSQSIKSVNFAASDDTLASKDVEAKQDVGPYRSYMIFSAICQGFCVMINLHSIFMLAGMAPTVFNVGNFAGVVAFTLEAGACSVNTLIFWMNALKPWLAVLVCVLQGLGNVFQIVVVATTEGERGKYFYIAGTAILGIIFGLNSMTSFALMAFGPENLLGPFSFGFAIGGVVPFCFSTILQNTIFTGKEVGNARGIMYCILGFVVIMSVVSAINLAIFFTRDPIKKHYLDIKHQGITSIKCTFRLAFKGLKYAWRIVLIQFISYVNILTFYPGVVPVSMNMDMGRKVMLIGVFQISETLGRGIAVFVNPRWLPCNTLNRVLALTICNVGTTVFLFCATIYKTVESINHIAVVTIGIITFGMVGGYCNSYADKSIEGEVPRHLDQDVIVSTTTVFKIIVSVFCALGSLTSTFLVAAISDSPTPAAH
ncbi:uncharacterized protein BXIN_0815 [Babesia sp. Xinjiang]|uniref:uncharacterized protein n=1 Tax=Babesia sp. Xinjiang TaxID=462227 RepID=UPI000A231E0F|nr:uncharacterized protein BXIN_0815 [Babesia sp. Xinjiang]ORM41311.1 hypothetical protein BXIN_0815 [Babesia sp. Xinjiang]